MIIKCPECREQVSTMTGTCPHCGIKISGHLRKCQKCGSYCLITQDKCPECGAELEEEQPQMQQQPTPSSTKGGRTEQPKKKTCHWVGWLLAILCLGLLCTGYYYYDKQQKQLKEQADYERLRDVTNPEFYQQFLIDYPESAYYDEINERMQVLQKEAEEWKQLQKNISRANVSRFMQDHPGSLRQRICEDMLDSIDWQDALKTGNEEAITNYLHQHPSGRYVSEAAERKNSLLLAKVTPAERAMIRGTLEAFFSKAIAKQDVEAAHQAIPDTMFTFCGKQNADAETIVQYAREKMAQDVIGLHYLIEQQMNVRKETLPDGNVGFAVEVSVQETISRSDTNRPTSNTYRVNALINQEQKIVRMNISQ